jgi:hypothetical protein
MSRDSKAVFAGALQLGRLVHPNLRPLLNPWPYIEEVELWAEVFSQLLW